MSTSSAPPNPPLQRTTASVAALPLAFAAERPYRWAAATKHGAVESGGDDMKLSEFLSRSDGFANHHRQHGLVESPNLLDAIAQEYASGPRRSVHGTIDGGVPDVQSFFLFWLPNRLVNLAYSTGKEPAPDGLDLTTPDGLGRALWLSHVCGYYFAVWLRLNLIRFDRERSASPLKAPSLSRAYARFVDPISTTAIGGSGERVVEYARESLRRRVAFLGRAGSGGRVLSLLLPTAREVGIFGFDSAWLHYILPPGRNAPTRAVPPRTPYFRCDRHQLLDATFAIPEEEYLADARARYAAIARSDTKVKERLVEAVQGRRGEAPLLKHQQRWYRVARFLYSRGIPGTTRYRGVEQEQYDRLISWAAYAVMIPQTNALNALTAFATRDAELARRQCRARAIWWALVTTYTFTVLDARHDGRTLDEALPHFD